MLPTKIEYADQLRPNSNSSTIPVTMPTAMLIRKIRPKKRLSRSQVTSLLRYACVCITATSKLSPIVMGTKKKWKTVTIANCQRARSSAIRGRFSRPERDRARAEGPHCPG